MRILTEFFELSLQLADIPSDWRKARVAPIHKKAISSQFQIIAQFLLQALAVNC